MQPGPTTADEIVARGLAVGVGVERVEVDLDAGRTLSLTAVS